MNLEKPLASYIDHTLLKVTVQEREIRQLCQEAIRHQFAAICVAPCYVPLAREIFMETASQPQVKPLIATVIGFPNGYTTTKTKAFEAGEAIEGGADEIDMVIHVGALKDRRFDAVAEDITAVVRASSGKLVKVIIETGLLENEEKKIAAQISEQAGAHFVKTCTGFSQGQASVEDIRLVREVLSPHMAIKASGGIRTQEDALAMIAAGATRIGTSSGAQIIAGQGPLAGAGY